MHGQFIWYELTTPDVDASAAFYPKFTGWGTQPFDQDYMMFTTGGVPFAGIFRLTDEMRQRGVPPNWMAYIEADDVDLTVKKAEAIGGKLVAGPGDIPGAGRYAVMQDPQGAMLGLYKSVQALGGAWDGVPVLGRFSWHELMTSDWKQAFDFYGALFDWKLMGEMDMGGGEMYQMFGDGTNMFGGMFTTPKDMAGMPPFWMLYIHVKDVAKAVKDATKAGASIHRPQMDIPGGSIAILGDPQGAGFAVHHQSEQAAPAAADRKPSAATRAKAAVKKAAKKVAKTAAKVKKTAAKVRKAATKAAKKAVRKAPGKKKAATKKPAGKKSAMKKSVRGVRKAVKKAAAKVGARKKTKSGARTSAARRR